MQAVSYLSEHYSNQVQDSPVTLNLNSVFFFLWTQITPQTLGSSFWQTLPLHFLPFMGAASQAVTPMGYIFLCIFFNCDERYRAPVCNPPTNAYLSCKEALVGS